MKLVYCSDPLNPCQPDEAYRAEAAAAERLGVPFSLVDHDALTHDGDPAKAVRRVPQRPNLALACTGAGCSSPTSTRLLYGALDRQGRAARQRSRRLRHCHYLPESYPVIQQRTPRSVWLRTGGELHMDRIMELLRPFGSAPWC